LAIPALNDLYRMVAKKVLTETLAVKRGESITVETWNNGIEFARNAVAEARLRGCKAIMVLEDEKAYIEGVKRSPRDTLGSMGDNEYGMLSNTDVYLFVPGPLLAAFQTKVKPELMADSTRYNGSWYEAAEKAKLRGARLTFGYVGQEMAGLMGRTVQQVVDRQLRAALVDFHEISKTAHKLTGHFSDGTEGTISSNGQQILFSFKGNVAVEDGVVSREDVEAGDNMTYVPPGFVTSAVDPKSATGNIKVSKSVTRLGLLKEATLTFSEGKLTEWASRENSLMLNELVKAVPDERRRLTLLNVGINHRMGYLFGQDRMVAGSVTMGGFGFTAVMRDADLVLGGKKVVDGGKL